MQKSRILEHVDTPGQMVQKKSDFFLFLIIPKWWALKKMSE